MFEIEMKILTSLNLRSELFLQTNGLALIVEKLHLNVTARSHLLMFEIKRKILTSLNLRSELFLQTNGLALFIEKHIVKL